MKLVFNFYAGLYIMKDIIVVDVCKLFVKYNKSFKL